MRTDFSRIIILLALVSLSKSTDGNSQESSTTLPKISGRFQNKSDALEALKKRFFKVLIDRGAEDSEVPRLRNRLKIAIQNRSKAEAKKPDNANEASEAATSAKSGDVVLDMITNAQDLKPTEVSEVLRIYRAATEQYKKFDTQISEAKRKNSARLSIVQNSTEDSPGVVSLYSLQETTALEALERVAALLHKSTLDHDYVFRAFLREQRRNPRGLFR